ncbi:complex I subunit 5 family protein [Natronohydrobacter thiooxidans]|uniref:complex I subunit 5 family protein n=1 Tax=Natronohydrobacter thiooxidans TaxID=87172 RepID=UPI0008FF25FC|nr:proton-conducting transporter membrane subunit [Natronohydrobacter thiooxidans]
MNALLPFAVLIWPLLLGLVPAVPRWRPHALWILPLAPLPALGLALAGAPGAIFLPDLLLGVHLAAVPGGALYLGMTALVWAAAGVHAALTLPPGPKAGALTGFWCLTLAGNLGVFLAGDVVTFYLAFAAVSLAAWFLVVHERTKKALAAGKLYITLAILGEAALLIGLMIGAAAAEDLRVSSVRAALPDAPLGPFGIAALLVGFGIKAGMIPLHLWLPVAHPAAPVPGSAVLSGAIVKAGLIGMILFIPVASGWGSLLVVAGLIGAFAAALWGLTQQDPKAVLAYSTVSQMGLLLTLVGAGSSHVAFYALHHGLAKAAMFLCVGVVAAAATPRARLLTLTIAGIMALSVSGFPLSGGALAKLASKEGLSDPLVLALTLSSMTTTLVLGWFMLRLARHHATRGHRPVWPGLFAGAAFLAALALLVPWFLWERVTGLQGTYPLGQANILAGLWPVMLGLVAVAVLRARAMPSYPPGDLLALLEMLRARLILVQKAAPQSRRNFTIGHRRRILRILLRSRRADSFFQPWPHAGFLLTVVTLAFAISIWLPN